MLLMPEEICPVVNFANYIEVAEGNSWPGHSIPDLELVLVVNGEFSVEDTEHPRTLLRHGDIVLIRGGFPCSLLRRGGNPAVISCIHLELFNGKSWKHGEYRIGPEPPWTTSHADDFTVVELFRRCAREFRGSHHYRTDIMSCLAKEIWLRVMAVRRGAGGGARGTRASRRSAEIAAFIRSHLADALDRGALANRFNLSPGHLGSMFKQEIGVPLTEFVIRERLLAAHRMLSSGECTVKEAAFKVGFNDPMYFSRLFHRKLGAPPSQYRQNH